MTNVHEQNNIKLFMHCGKCLKELPEKTSPRDYTRNEVGWTKEGFQVWCIRHEMNVINISFEGKKVARLA